MLSYSYFSSMQQLMSASHGALTAISAAGKVEEILEMDTSRAYDPSLPTDPEDFEGIRMEQVSYGYEGRERALIFPLGFQKAPWRLWLVFRAVENPQSSGCFFGFMRQRRARSSSMGFHWKKSVSGSFISALLFWSSTLAGCDRILKMVEARK